MVEPREPTDAEIAELGAIPLFADLPPILKKLVARFRQFGAHPAGAVFLEQGAYAEDFHVVLSGGVSAYRTEADGTTELLESLGPGGWFGEVSALSSQPSLATLKADVPVAVLSIDPPTFKELYFHKLATGFRARIDARYRERSLPLHLRAIPLFADVDRRSMQRIARHVDFRTFEKGAVLVPADEPLDALWFVRTGAVEATRSTDGVDRVQSYLMNNSSFGEHALVAGASAAPATYTAMARTDVLVLPVAKLRAELAGAPEVLAAIQARAARRVDEERGALDHDLAVAGAGTPRTADELEIMVRRQSIKGGEALVIDLQRCTRCNACVESCVAVHEDRVPRLSKRGNRISSGMSLVTSCYHCEIPECMLGCNYGAIRRDVSGRIRFEYDNCVGCAECVSNCPYGVIRLTEGAESSPVRERPSPLASIPLLGALFRREPQPSAGSAESIKGRLTPRGKQMKGGKAVKCDLCAGLPFEACVYNCPADAIHRVEPSALFAPGTRVVARTDSTEHGA